MFQLPFKITEREKVKKLTNRENKIGKKERKKEIFSFLNGLQIIQQQHMLNFL